MISKYSETPSRSHQWRDSLQKQAETRKLVVHGDAQGLEGARRGMDPARAPSRRVSDDRCQPAGRFYSLFATSVDYRASDSARCPLLAKFEDDAGKLRLITIIYDVGGSDAFRRIHAHVERTIGGEAKTTR